MTPELFKLSKANCCVYWIRLPEHTDMFSQGYIGISSDVRRRWRAHFEKNGNTHLANAVNKYGKNKIIKEMVLISKKQYCLEIEKKLRPSDQIGWNITSGGGNPPVGKSRNSMYKKGFTPWNKGKSHTEETKLKISLSKKGVSSWNKGKPMPEEVKAKVSTAKKGVPKSPESIAKSAESRRGKKRSEETKRKISESHAKRRLMLATLKEKNNGINN